MPDTNHSERVEAVATRFLAAASGLLADADFEEAMEAFDALDAEGQAAALRIAQGRSPLTALERASIVRTLHRVADLIDPPDDDSAGIA